MKRFLILILALLLVGCQPQVKEDYLVDGLPVEVNEEEGIATHGENVYKFRSGNNYLEITYPNGFVYNEEYSSGITTSTWQADVGIGFFEIENLGYMNEEELVAAIKSGIKVVRERQVNPLICFLIIIIGAFLLIFPKAAWYLRTGWRIKDAEPSDLGLAFERGVGGLMIVGGIITLLIG